MEDTHLVQQKIAYLNSRGGNWIAAEGNYALTTVTGDFSTKANVVFSPSNGIPGKVFINTVDGEIKIFHANLFERR